MIGLFKKRMLDLIHLFYPHLCAGCNTDFLSVHDPVCPSCIASLPETGFENIPGNPAEKTFYGRIPLKAVSSAYYFSKDSILQYLIHALKYEKNKKTGFILGQLTGNLLKNGTMFTEDYLLVAVPMHPGKEKLRGYNQASIIANGIAQITGWSLCEDAVIKTTHTDTQTKKGRNERWENIREVFQLKNADPLKNKHILLIDDVLTTGATIEACGSCMLEAAPASLSVATIAWAGG
jgi:ComF family protein